MTYNERKHELMEKYLMEQRQTESEALKKSIFIDFLMEEIQLAKESEIVAGKQEANRYCRIINRWELVLVH